MASSSAPANDTTEPPVSPVARQTTFPHKTSAAVSTRTPFIDTATPAINAAPVELDGVPTSPLAKEKKDAGNVGVVGLGEEAEIEAEFLGEGSRSGGREVSEVRPCNIATQYMPPMTYLKQHLFLPKDAGCRLMGKQKRKEMLAQRGRDPGVIVDLPTEPTAEEVRAAKAMEGAVTPGVEGEREREQR